MGLILGLTRIVQAAAEAATPERQVNLIVDSIQQEMGVDVCSLYLAGDNADMVLVASHGLGRQAIGRTRLETGKGLVGLVARTSHPLNIINPDTHPNFFHVPGIGEENYRSFCAVPLVRAGNTVGVLAVQCLEARQLSPEEEAFLVMLSAQLALVVAAWSDWQAGGLTPPQIFHGVRGAPGIGIGVAHLCEDTDLFSVIDAPCADPTAATADWHALLARVQDDVAREQAMLGETLSSEVTAIFDAYHMLLGDPALVSGVERAIAGGKDLPSALKAVVQHYADLFMAMEDPYLRARHEDIRHLGNRLYSAWRGSRAPQEAAEAGTPLILVGTQVSVSDIAAMPREALAGLVCLEGSSMSHTAILANALGIPAVMGIGRARTIAQGAPMLVDANLGNVLVNPAPGVESEYRRLAAAEQALRGRLQNLRDEPAITPDGERVTMFVNSGLLADLSPGLTAGAEGIGLYRTEIPFMVRDGFPSEEEQFNIYRHVLEAYRGKPVYLRVLDIGGDKALPYFPIREENPALGWRGIRFCLDNSPLLMTQLRAMLRADAGAGSLSILVPMVSATRELERFRALLQDALSQLHEEGYPVVRPRIGVMVEVPAAISQLPLWREQIDFISIGSNDLSQYLLAVDRNNPRVAAAYDYFNPAVIREIKRIADIARDLDLPVSVCGEMSSDPAAAILLIGMGIRTLSMSAARLPRIKWLVRNLEVDTAEALLAEIMLLADSTPIRDRLHAFLLSIDFPGLPGSAH